MVAHHRLMDFAAIAHEIFLGRDELLERRLDVVEIDIGNEAVDAGIDAGRPGPVHIPARRHEIGQHFEISKAARIGDAASRQLSSVRRTGKEDDHVI